MSLNEQAKWRKSMRARNKMAAAIVVLVAVGGCGTNEETTQVSSALFAFPDQIGVFRSGTWYLDSNGNNFWDGTPTDSIGFFGQAGDKPVTARAACNPFAGTKQLF